MRSLLLLTVLKTIACAGPIDGSYPATLAQLSSNLTVSVEVLGTSKPATERRVRVILQPGPSSSKDVDHQCPVIEAKASINGAELGESSNGEYFSAGYSGCRPILFERALPDGPTPDLLQEPCVVEVTDGSGSIHVQGHGLFHAPSASFLTPSDGAMVLGSTAGLQVQPSAEVLPGAGLQVSYVPDQAEAGFECDQVTITDAGLSFDVPATTMPSSGKLTVIARIAPFKGIVDRCEGAQTCTLTRAACDVDCTAGVADGGGFDEFDLDASVVAVK